jgi:amidohydrolase
MGAGKTMGTYEQVKDEIRKREIGKHAIEYRRYLHQHPELSRQESNTADFIAEKLTEFGIPCKKGIAGNGVIGVIEGTSEPSEGTKRICAGLRADMDALPIPEETDGISFCSQNPGVMHACGHDAHTAILLGVAELLSAIRDKLPGTVKLIFQPDEEDLGGAEPMIKAGVLEDPHVDIMLGLHVDPNYPAGMVAFKYGQMQAASDMIQVSFHGKSCHGAEPSRGVDAILMAGQFLTNVQAIVSRNVSPVDSAVVTFGTIQGGHARNQIADRVELSGIIRTLTPENRLYARQRVKEIAEHTAAMQGGTAEYIVEPSYGPLINDDHIVDLVRESVEKAIGPEHVALMKYPSLGVEDFAYFAMKRPACFYHLGVGFDGTNVTPLHSAKFLLNEDAIPLGVSLQANAVLYIMTQQV